MIYTLTPNPAIDYNICCDGLQPNTVTRTRDAVYTPNGKGLNVSFTLDHYGVDTAILGFFAGFSGRYIVEGARELGVDVKPVWTEGITRVNVFLNAGPDTEYNMVNAGAAITARPLVAIGPGHAHCPVEPRFGLVESFGGALFSPFVPLWGQQAHNG